VPRRGGPTGPLGDGMAGVDTATEERPLVARESTRVRQQVADGDRRDRRVGDRRVDELCQGVANRSVELDLPGLDELQHIQATVPRNSVPPMISKARRTPTPRSRLLMPVKSTGPARSWRPAGCCDEQRPMTPRRQCRAARRRLSPPGGTPHCKGCGRRTAIRERVSREPSVESRPELVPESLAVEVGEFDVLRRAGVDPLDERGHVDFGLGFGQTVGAAGLDADAVGAGGRDALLPVPPGRLISAPHRRHGRQASNTVEMISTRSCLEVWSGMAQVRGRDSDARRHRQDDHSRQEVHDWQVLTIGALATSS
jgi:hypothetical protein